MNIKKSILKKSVILSILFVFLVSFVPFSKIIKADEEYGVVDVNGVEMYRDTHGNLYPIVAGSNGEKEVILNRYEEEPLKALLQRDANESKGESNLPDYALKKYYSQKNFSTSASSYVTLPSIYSYKQGYWKWGGETLGFCPDTIKDSGCFLTSCAIMLATYNLTINDSIVNPLNLNTWLKSFQYNPNYPNKSGGFDHDILKFSAIAHFPGIGSIDLFDSCDDAKIAIAYGGVPIIAVHHPGLHFCVLAKTNGKKNTATNYIVNTYDPIHHKSSYNAPEHMYYAPYDGITGFNDHYYSTLARARYTFADSNIFRIAWPQHIHSPQHR